MYVQLGIHDTVEYAELCCTTVADATPNMEFDGVFWAWFIAGLLILASPLSMTGNVKVQDLLDKGQGWSPTKDKRVTHKGQRGHNFLICIFGCDFVTIFYCQYLLHITCSFSRGVSLKFVCRRGVIIITIFINSKIFSSGMSYMYV